MGLITILWIPVSLFPHFVSAPPPSAAMNLHHSRLPLIPAPCKYYFRQLKMTPVVNGKLFLLYIVWDKYRNPGSKIIGVIVS